MQRCVWCIEGRRCPFCLSSARRLIGLCLATPVRTLPTALVWRKSLSTSHGSPVCSTSLRVSKQEREEGLQWITLWFDRSDRSDNERISISFGERIQWRGTGYNVLICGRVPLPCTAVTHTTHEWDFNHAEPHLPTLQRLFTH